MFRTRDILIRIRILGSVPLTNRSNCGYGYGRGSCSGYGSRFCFFMFLSYAYSQNSKNQGFSSFLCLWKDPELDPDLYR
jgi:hypothetical protein